LKYWKNKNKKKRYLKVYSKEIIKENLLPPKAKNVIGIDDSFLYCNKDIVFLLAFSF